MTQQTQKFETLTIHAGQSPDSDAGSRALPIHQTTSFVFPSAESAADRFALAEAGHIYSRINNPTQGAVEDRIAALEGGAAGLLLASGQSAITLSILNLAGTGDSIAVSPSLYGGSFNLFKHTLKRLGITAQWVADPTDPESWRAAADDTTRAFFVESIPNPKQDIPDLRAIADVAHEVGVPLIVDNTVATPFLLRPLEHGADVVVHSATKFLGGHGTSIAGVIVDGDSFDFAA
ncbi:MAG: PLP-dependent transferase, partial [Brachybacterium sp.]